MHKPTLRGKSNIFLRRISSTKIHSLLTVCLVLHSCINESATKKATQNPLSHTFLTRRSNSHQIYPQECGSIDIRNDCSSFQQLENCTVIKGYLMIVLLTKDKYIDNGSETCDYDKISFPLLREITDFIIMFHVESLRSMRNLFPNLTVIRGRRLFLNYAIGISEMANLESIELSSLVAIQRGHVFISSSPKLCQLEMINWDRLTLTAGQNHIYPVAPETCKEKSICHGCNNHYCWSSTICQKFENESVLNIFFKELVCHEECLGGCYNTTNTGCVVCRRLTDHGTCVKDCPPDKYMDEHTQRCYTRDECIHEMKLLAHEGLCIPNCPSGFTSNKNGSCEACPKNETCIHVCQPEKNGQDPFVVYDLSGAERLSSCQVLNGTLIISIRNKVNENDLAEKFKNLLEIKGYLKIYRSPYLTTLKFLSNLRKIRGTPSESGHFSLVVYDNKNLKELWNPHLELDRGGMYIHLNNRLCNIVIMAFTNKVIHDNSEDSIQISDQETLCGPVKLSLNIEILSHRELLFSWSKDQTADEIEIMYRPIPKGETFNAESELDTPVCERITWYRELVFKSDLRDNGTHYSYIAEKLNQNTKYACLVKTFGSHYQRNSRSDLVFITTGADVPPPPIVKIVNKTDNSLTFELKMPNTSLDYMVEYYLVEVYKKPDDVHYLDKRNYCTQSAHYTKNLFRGALFRSASDESYDDCCAREEDDKEDERFMANIQSEFSCSLDRKHNCIGESPLSDTDNAFFSLRLQSNESTYTFLHLERFRLYVLMAKACNRIGCSSFSMHSERTNYTTAGDLVGELDGCHTSNGSEYRVFFTEPKKPNGAIVSYVVHFRHYIADAEHFQSRIGCVTRLNHEKSNFVFVRHMNSTFNQVAVRAHSLAGDAITHWFDITPCDGPFSVSTKMAGFDKKNPPKSNKSGHSVNTFLIFFIMGCIGTILWVCYKQRYWRRIQQWRNFSAFRRTRDAVRTLVQRDVETSHEDRLVLVDNFETVRFHNRRDDFDDNDTTTCSSLSEG